MSAIEPIYNQVMKELSEEEREVLALKILHNDHASNIDEVPQWLKDELDEVSKRIHDGTEKGIPAEEVYKELRELLNANR